MSLSLKIVTPIRIAFEESGIDSVTAPTPNGEITILPNHIPLISKLETGELIVRKGLNENSMVVTDGFLKLDKQGAILILSDYAIRSDEIETAKVEAAKNKAEAAMKDKTSSRDFAIAEAELRRTLLELKIANKRSHTTGRV